MTDRDTSPVPPGAADAPAVAGRSREVTNRLMLRARDAIDRDYAAPLDIARLARIAFVSEGHFIRTFHAVFGEPPHRYLQRRRVERAMALLRDTDHSVTEICLAVGFTSLGTFSRTFRGIVGESPSGYRRRRAPAAVPTCFTMSWTRPAVFAVPEAPAAPAVPGSPAAALPESPVAPPPAPRADRGQPVSSG